MTSLIVKCILCQKETAVSRKVDLGRGSQQGRKKTRLSRNDLTLLDHARRMKTFTGQTLFDIMNMNMAQYFNEQNKAHSWEFERLGVLLSNLVGAECVEMITRPHSHMLNEETQEYESYAPDYRVTPRGKKACLNGGLLEPLPEDEAERQICPHVSIRYPMV